MQVYKTATAPDGEDYLDVQIKDGIATLHLNRPSKRNALNDGIIDALYRFFQDVPEEVKAIVLAGHGECFSAGLDLSELSDTSIVGGIGHSMRWHRAFEAIQFGPVPVVSVIHGACVGGGLELAASTHIRVAEKSAFFALPEGQRGIFVGGGGSVRLPRLIGMQRMTDMMLTGRVMEADEAKDVSLAQYVTENGAGLALAQELAGKIAKNAPLTNFAVINVLPRTADLPPEGAYILETLMAAIAQGDDLAKERLEAFLSKKAAKVR